MALSPAEKAKGPIRIQLQESRTNQCVYQAHFNYTSSQNELFKIQWLGNWPTDWLTDLVFLLQSNLAVLIMSMYTAYIKIIIASIISTTVISLNIINR
jgi:hypothetical protein